MKNLILAAYILYLPFQLKVWIPIAGEMNSFFLFLLLGVLIGTKDKLKIKTRFQLPLILFLFSWAFSCIYTIVLNIQIYGTPTLFILKDFKRLIVLVLGYLVFAHCIKTKKDILFLVNIFILCICLAGISTLRTGILAGPSFGDHKRAFGPFGTNFWASDIAGGFLATFSPLVLSYTFFAKNRLLRLLSLFGFIVCSMATMATYSRGSMLALAAGSLIVIIYSWKPLLKRSKVYGFMFFIALIIAIANWQSWMPQSILTRVDNTFAQDGVSDRPDLDDSSQLRITKWQNGLETFYQNPILGIGFNQTRYNSSTDSHNTFIQIASEMGIFGLFSFFWFIIMVWLEANSISKTESILLGKGVLGMMTAFCIVNIFYSNFFRDTVVGTFWVTLGLLSASKNLLNAPELPRKKERKRPRYAILILTFFLVSMFNPHFTWAEPTQRWWDTGEKTKLNVYNDIPHNNKGRVYYVDQKTGNDKNDGKTFKYPFKTIKQGVRKLRAGDILLIKAGRYKETIYASVKGDKDNRILIGPFGDGEVIIDPSIQISSWNLGANEVYQAKCPEQPIAVIVDDKPIYPALSLDSINPNEWHYDAKNQILSLKLNHDKDPNQIEIGVVPDHGAGIFLHGAQYVTIYGLTIKYAGAKGIGILGNNNRIEKCNIKFSGKHGIGIFEYGNTTSENTEIIKNNIHHNFLRNWPRGKRHYKKGSWGAGISGSGAPNSLISGNIVTKNGGEGIGAVGDHNIIQDNIVSDNWSVNIYVDRKEDILIDKNLIICHEPNPQDLYHNRDAKPQDGKNLRRLRAEGIMTGDENSPSKINHIQMTNNIIIGCRRGITHYGHAEGSGLKNILVANNTIVVPNAKGNNEKYVGIRVPFNKGNNVNAVYRNNIIYGSHPDTYLLYVTTDPKIQLDPLHGLTFDHNLWYHSKKRNPFHIGPTWFRIHDITFKAWIKKAQAHGSIFADPFFSEYGKYTASSVKPLSGSKALNAAIKIDTINQDYNYTKRDPHKPDIGAIEVK